MHWLHWHKLEPICLHDAQEDANRLCLTLLHQNTENLISLNHPYAASVRIVINTNKQKQLRPTDVSYIIYTVISINH